MGQTVFLALLHLLVAVVAENRAWQLHKVVVRVVAVPQKVELVIMAAQEQQIRVLQVVMGAHSAEVVAVVLVKQAIQMETEKVVMEFPAVLLIHQLLALAVAVAVGKVVPAVPVAQVVVVLEHLIQELEHPEMVTLAAAVVEQQGHHQMRAVQAAPA